MILPNQRSFDEDAKQQQQHNQIIRWIMRESPRAITRHESQAVGSGCNESLFGYDDVKQPRDQIP